MASKRFSKILVVDDDKISRKILTRNVENWGYVSVTSSNGLRAWELLSDNPDIKLVITDVMMPGMDGKELIRVLQDDRVLSKIPIVVMSGVISVSELTSLLEIGASRFLAKPIKPKDLQHAVESLIGASVPLQA